jgi:hypothetical protein
MAELIGSLYVEERVRAKDNRGKEVESSAVNVVQKKNSFVFRNNKKKKNKQENDTKPKQTAEFKKKTTRKVEVALFAEVMSIGQVRAQTTNISKKRNLQTW